MKKLIKRTKKNDEGFALAYQITEKLIRRGGNLLYSNFIDRWLYDYWIQMQIEMMAQQTWIYFLSYNTNIDFKITADQVFSKRLYRSGTSSQILKRYSENDVNYIMK